VFEQSLGVRCHRREVQTLANLAKGLLPRGVDADRDSTQPRALKLVEPLIGQQLAVGDDRQLQGAAEQLTSLADPLVQATIEEGLETLTGVAPGARDADGRYPEDSIFGKVDARLTQLAEDVGRFGAGDKY